MDMRHSVFVLMSMLACLLLSRLLLHSNLQQRYQEASELAVVRRHILMCQAVVAVTLLAVTVNQAETIPCHSRGRLLGPELNSMYRKPRQYRSIYWVKPVDTMWFEAHLMSQYEEHDFRAMLRADRKTFWNIVSKLNIPLLQRVDTSMRKAKTLPKRVAIGLYHYAHGGTYLTTGQKFGCSIAFAHGAVRDFIKGILSQFSHLVSFPSGSALKNVMKGFESKRQFPNCFGAIDCSHFLFSTPSIADYKGYYDRHGQTTAILQAVVDSQGRFLDTYAGTAGSVPDNRVFDRSPLSNFLNQGMLSEPVAEIDGGTMNIRPYMVGDAGYVLKKFCMIPYPGNELSDPMKERFNYWQSSTRIIVEQAFGRLKGRFRWLNGRIIVHNPMLHADIISVGCILHNMMMDSDYKFDKQWANGVRLRCGSKVRPEKEHFLDARGIRDVLCRHVYERNSS